MWLQAQERAAEEDRRRNEAERAELDLEGGGGMLLDPVQLGFHEPEKAAASERTPDEAAPDKDASKKDAPNQAVIQAGEGVDAGERGSVERRREGDASERGEDLIGQGAEAIHSAAKVVDVEERNAVKGHAAKERGEDSGNTGASGNLRVPDLAAKGADKTSKLESAPGEAGKDEEKVLQSIKSAAPDAASAEERDAIEIGRAEEGDLSRGAESTRQRLVSDGAPDEADPPDTLVLGGGTKESPAAGAKLKTVELADDAPRLLGYRRAKDDGPSTGTELTVLGQEDAGGQDVGRETANEEARENEIEMRALEEEDARPAS